jgi:lambda repressor-like predicted transcriptional regulator
MGRLSISGIIYNFNHMITSTSSDNSLFDIARAFVAHTGCNLFLTGKAGTGKTTFLRQIRESLPKEMVVVAPTGVAAINAGGVTMHSFFQLPFGPFVPKGSWASAQNESVHNAATLISKIRFNDTKRQLLRNLELLIIDEVSMVRADMLDAMDAILRHFRKKRHQPFGGVQVLFIGDLFQLPPVVQDSEWEILRPYYDSPFFFDAQVLREHPPVCIELQKVFRQSDDQFVKLLNRVRDNQLTQEDLDLLNSTYQPAFSPPKEANFITLSTHNHKAAAINERELGKLPGKSYRYKASVEGDFSDKAYPADEVLELREGAQIMFIKNDKGEYRRYYNGKIGLVSHLDAEGGITVRFPNEEEEITLEKENWDNIRYSFNEESQSIEEKKLGQFSQYPIRLAWAITIHKSQGLTFERAIIDAGSSFSPGQVYVALSRLTGMSGLVLHSRIGPEAVRSDDRVVSYMRHRGNEKELLDILQQEQQKYMALMLTEAFEWAEVNGAIYGLLKSLEKRKLPKPSVALETAQTLLQQSLELKKVSERFIPKVGQLLQQVPESLPHLKERVAAAAGYFTKEIKSGLLAPLTQHAQEAFGWKRVKQYTNDLKSLEGVFLDKIYRVHRASLLATGMAAGQSLTEIMQEAGNSRSRWVDEVKEKFPHQRPTEKAEKKKKAPPGETYRITQELYREGKSIEDIARERNLSPSTIETHMARLVSQGELTAVGILGPEKTEMIRQAIAATKPPLLNEVMRKLGDEFSFGEVRIVMAQHPQATKDS